MSLLMDSFGQALRLVPPPTLYAARSPRLLAGYVPARVEDIWGEKWGKTNVGVVVTSVAHARRIAPAFTFLRSAFEATLRLFPIVAVDPRAPAGVDTRDAILNVLGVTWNVRERKVRLRWLVAHAPWPGLLRHLAHLASLTRARSVRSHTRLLQIGVWDIDLAKLGNPTPLGAGAGDAAHIGTTPTMGVNWRDTNVATETTEALAGVFETMRPAAVILPFDEGSAVAVAAAATAASMRIPAIGLTSDSPDCVEKSVRMGEAAPVTMCLPRHGVTFTRGTYNFVTNSQLLVAKHLLDTLCTCEKASSEGVGAFAKCPDLGSNVVISEFHGSLTAP